MSEFSHLDKHGNVKMVDVTDKMTTARMAKAEGKISILPPGFKRRRKQLK